MRNVKKKKKTHTKTNNTQNVEKKIYDKFHNHKQKSCNGKLSFIFKHLHCRCLWRKIDAHDCVPIEIEV